MQLSCGSASSSNIWVVLLLGESSLLPLLLLPALAYTPHPTTKTLPHNAPP